MYFNVAQQASSIHSGLGQNIRIPAKAANSLGHADAITIKTLQVLWIEFTGQNLASEVGVLITDSFFVRKAGDFDGKRKAGFRILQMSDASQGDENSER